MLDSVHGASAYESGMNVSQVILKTESAGLVEAKTIVNRRLAIGWAMVRFVRVTCACVPGGHTSLCLYQCHGWWVGTQQLNI